MVVGPHGKSFNTIRLLRTIMTTVLVIGYGSIGRRHVQNLLRFTNMKIIILSKRKKIALDDFDLIPEKTIKQRLEISNSLQQCILKKPQIAFVTNETSKHILIAVKLAKLGMDLFIEKPLSNSSLGIRELKKIIQKKKLICMIGCNFRFYPPIQKIKKLLDTQNLGKIHSIHIENGSYLPDWHPYENYIQSYASRKILGGGVTLTQIHELDYLCWFVGIPKEVTSVIDKISTLKINVDDINETILKFRKSVIGVIHLDFFQRPSFKRCKIRGSKGTLEWNSIENKINLYTSKTKKYSKIKIPHNYALTSNKVNKMYVEELQYFFNCVKNRTQPMNNLSEAEHILNVVLSMKKSSMTKKTVKI